MSHTLFNVFGMIFFFLVPITRRLPICLAKFCGVEAGKYRWWAFMYTASMFFIIPVGLFAISVISVPAATGKYAQKKIVKIASWGNCQLGEVLIVGPVSVGG